MRSDCFWLRWGGGVLLFGAHAVHWNSKFTHYNNPTTKQLYSAPSANIEKWNGWLWAIKYVRDDVLLCGDRTYTHTHWIYSARIFKHDNISLLVCSTCAAPQIVCVCLYITAHNNQCNWILMTFSERVIFFVVCTHRMCVNIMDIARNFINCFFWFIVVDYLSVSSTIFFFSSQCFRLAVFQFFVFANLYIFCHTHTHTIRADNNTRKKNWNVI